MKATNTKTSLVRSCIAFAAMIAIWSPASSWSAEPAEGKGMKTENTMMDKCEEMKMEKKKIQAEMKALDAELTAAVVTMNGAAQDEKINLMAGVVTQLVEQRKAMHDQKAEMQQKMMKHMMEHMEMGRESMSKCPMMKEMKGMDDSSEGNHNDHKDHRQEQK